MVAPRHIRQRLIIPGSKILAEHYTLVATRSLFLVLYSTLLSIRFRGLLGERMTPATVAIKFAAVTLIVGGVAGISLS